MTFDPEWLAIVRTFVPLFSRKRQQPPFPDEATARASIARELEWVSEHALDQRIDAVQTFEMTVAGGSSGPTKELRAHITSVYRTLR
jgi:lariat debranching enzyme